MSSLEYYGQNSLKEYRLPQNPTSGFGFPVKGTKKYFVTYHNNNNNYYDGRIQSNCQNNKITPSTVPM